MFNLRLRLLLLALHCAATIGCMAPAIAQVSSEPVDEAAIVKKIKALGGKAYWEEKLPKEPILAVQIFSNSKFTDEDFKLLKDLKGLTWLRLEGSGVTGTGLAELKDLENFQTLYWMGKGNKSLEGLKELKYLQELQLPHETTDADLKEIKQMMTLKRLYLHGQKITDAGLREVKEMSGLEELSLGSTEVTDLGLKEVKEMKNLQSLDLSRTRITDVGLKELKEMESLRSLYLDCTAITDSGFKELKDVQVLSIGFGESLPNPELTELTDAALIAIKRMPNIRELTIRGHNFTDAGLDALRGTKSLERLVIRGDSFTDAGFEALKELGQLSALILSGTIITDSGVKTIAKLKNLKALVIEGPGITDASLEELKDLKNLEELSLRGTSITDAGVSELKAALPNTSVEKYASTKRIQ